MSGANASATGGVQDRRDAEQGNHDPSHEPSMEEILASIRRIISDDQMLPLSPRASLPPLPASAVRPHGSEVQGHLRSDSQPAQGGAAGEADEHSDVLDLADIAQQEDDEPRRLEARHEHEGQASDDGVQQDEPHPPHEAREAAAAAAAPEAGQPTPLAPRLPAAGHEPQSVHAPDPVSEPDPAPEAIVSAETLSSVSSHFHQLTATMLMQNFPPVDHIARELLRPMIKTWLDDNLPVMVERLVRAEIERVSRVGR